MKTATATAKLLISWLGRTDLDASQGKEEAGLGPVAQALKHRRYDRAVLLSNYARTESTACVKWLQQHTDSPIDLRLIDRKQLSDPTNFGEIYTIVTDAIQQARRQYGEGSRLTYHLSPGTPAMQAVWIIVAKTRYAAELIQSSREKGVVTATIPFDISAEFIPELFRSPDRDLERLTQGLPAEAPGFEGLIHQSTVMKRVVAKARRIAPRSISVLIEGDSGTGKEVLARAIHDASSRKDAPFIPVNCGAISVDLAESEFFGHKKGAFTGATADRKGHFESAHGGTLFLDEVGELPLSMQVKLLRVLQDRKVVPVGTSHPIPIDVRIIAATNRSLREEVAEGRFREDLFYRLAVAVIRLPPLRQRAGDLHLLIDHVLAQINEGSTAEPDWKQKVLSPGARNLLLQHDWPGNVRELMNTLTRAAVWSGGETITKEDMREALLEAPPRKGRVDAILGQPIEDGVDLKGLIATVARHYMERALIAAPKSKQAAAELLGLGSYQVLDNWLNKYKLPT